MLEFRSKRSRAPNYLGRREQRRMLFLVLLLGVVLFIMPRAGDPNTWRWMWGQRAEPARIDRGDTRLNVAPRKPLPPGTFIAVAPDEPAKPSGRKAEAGAPQPAAEKPPEVNALGKRRFNGVRADFLKDVRDDTVFRSSEVDAFYHLFQILKQTDERTLEAASTGPVAFAQLFNQPEVYRGELVTLQGVIHRAFELPAGKNDYGIARYHQLWLKPNDRPDPIVLYCLDLPDGFPTGMDLEKQELNVRLTGFFYKRWAYRAGDGIRTAPLVLAKTLNWRKPAPGAGGRGPQPNAQRDSFLLSVVAAGIVALIVVLYVLGRTRRGASNREQAAAAFGVASAAVGPNSSSDVHEHLQRLAEEQAGS